MLICDDAALADETFRGELHHLPAAPSTVHWGYFDAAMAPAGCGMIRSRQPASVFQATRRAVMDGAVRLFDEIPVADRDRCPHHDWSDLRQGAVGDMLEVRYLQMIPRVNYGSNLAANWGYLYKSSEKRTGDDLAQPVTNQAEALYAYDFPGKYLVPGTVTRTARSVIASPHWRASESPYDHTSARPR